MAQEGKKISSLDTITTLKDSDLVIIVETSETGAAQTTKKATVSNLRSQLTAAEAIDYYRKSETLTESEINTLVNTRFNSDTSGIAGGVYNRSYWDTAYSWVNTNGATVLTKVASLGNRNASNGFAGLDSAGQVALDQLGYVIPTSHPVGNVTTNDIGNWNASYSWGNHAQAGYALDADISVVGKSGAYADLTGKPTNATQEVAGLMSATDKVTLDNLVTTTTETATNLNSSYVKKTDLATDNANGLLAKGDYTKLQGIETGAEVNVQADWSVTDVASDAYIKNKPSIPVDVADLTDNGSLLNSFDGDYNSLINKPTLFTGSYTDLTDKPTLFSGAYADLTGLPTLFDGAYSSLTGAPTIPADVSDLTDTTGKFFSGAYADLTGLPTLFSGAYVDLTGTPSIPTDVGDLTDTGGLLDHFSLGAETTTTNSYATLEAAMLAGAPANGVFVRLHDNGDTTYDVVYRPIL